ncbi:MAG: hypothetical protein M0R03_19370 [Novosphingobium sp.]|nr:hypothetical protein [Novosphingobium sp.]
MSNTKLFVPNLSERISSSDCAKCKDNCCEKFEIFYPYPDESEESKIFYSEIKRFLMLETIGEKITTRDDDTGTWLVFNFPCRFLRHDKTCNIYNSPHRPLLCRKFPYACSTKKDCSVIDGGQP